MAEFPKCPNFTKKRGCEKSDIKLLGENEDAWTFRCATCELIYVCSKPSSKARGQFRAQEEKLRQEAERRKKHDSRRMIFT
jgi:hypothetical protein